ncbi:hypothetical protein JRQ81_000761, partial [Phrynocephalus forsythii]
EPCDEVIGVPGISSEEWEILQGWLLNFSSRWSGGLCWRGLTTHPPCIDDDVGGRITITSRIKNLLRSPSIKLRRSKPGSKKEDIGTK